MLDEDDQESCFKLICGRHWKYKGLNDRTIKPDAILEVYSYMVNAMCSLSSAIRMKLYDNAPETLDVSKDNDVLKGVISMYLDYKKRRKYIDYDDILLTVSKYLKKNEHLRKHVAQLYDHILVDEMQDTNPLQYELLSSFYEDCHLFCVGDDAQSIYGFRGADFKTIHRFSEIVEDAEVCKLTTNYRSTQELLDLSNWLLSQSSLNYDKKLIAHRGKGNMPVFKHWADEWEEANDVANTILYSYRNLGKQWRDNLVLARSAWKLKKVEACLLKHKIPYMIFGGRGLMSSRHVRDVVSPMRIVSNYLDEIAWSRYLQIWDGIGAVNAAEIIGKVINTNCMEDSIQELSEIITTKKFQKEIAETLLSISTLQYNPAKAMEYALKIMSRQLEKRYNDEWGWRSEDFPILQEVAKKTGSIAEFIAEYVLDPKLDTTKKDVGKVEDAVILSTIHSSKGLESSIVYLINASVLSFPTQRAILTGEDCVEEERRCLYVALTRAKDHLYVYRDIHSLHVSNKDSEYYFFNEIPSNLYDSSVIAAHYFLRNKIDLSQVSQEDIYSDFNLD